MQTKVVAILLDNSAETVDEGLQGFLDKTVHKLKLIANTFYYIRGDGISRPLRIPEGIEQKTFKTSAEFLDYFSQNHPSTELLILPAFSPLLDMASLQAMINEHTTNRYDYTYPENLPKGLLPEIIHTGVLAFIRNTVPESVLLFKESIREIFERDLSSYDSNIFISESRLVKYRVNFVPENRNSAATISAILEKGGDNLGITGLEQLLSQNPGLLRRYPSYYEIELNTEREVGGSFVSTLLAKEGSMSLSTFEKAFTALVGFSINPMVSIGLYGEPFLHPDIVPMLAIIEKNPQVRVLFESRSIFSSAAAIEKALALPNVSVIFDISAATPETFERLKKPLNPIIPFEGYAAITQKIKALPKERVYIQFTRTAENEAELMRFYDIWRDYGERLIIKKPDTFGGKLDKIRVVDLSPVERFACYHQKNDMVIRHDGTVALCREDANAENSFGNINNDNLETLFERLRTPYEAQWKGVFDNPPLCRACDEWWVFYN